MSIYVVFFFFFQAEDGIRDLTVTGVQTCALPISYRGESLYLILGNRGVCMSKPLRPRPGHAGPLAFFNVVLQGSGAPESLVGAVRAAVASLDKSLALFHVRTMPQIIAEAMTTTQYETVLLVSMAGLALLLAAVGTYGVMSYVVGQRSNEIGIRMALGARPMEIFAMVLWQAF